MSAFDHRALLEEYNRRRTSGFNAYLTRTEGHVPKHLLPLTSALENAFRGTGPRKLVVVMAPGFGKSTTVRHFIEWGTGEDQSLRTLYMSYSNRLAAHHVRLIRAGAIEHANVVIDPTSRSQSEWRTAAGGHVLASSLYGTATGFRGDIVVVDDHTSGRAEAESVVLRERGIDAFKGTARTRVEPGTGIVLIVSTWWHPADLTAWAIENGYHVVHIPAIGADGESTWPERFSTSELRAIEDELGPRDWTSLFMGSPVVQGATLFDGASLVEASEIPSDLHVAIGMDAAYSSSANADFTVLVAMGVDLSDGHYYVLDVLRTQMRVDAFEAEFTAFVRRFGGAPVTWHCSGTELGVADLLRRSTSIPIRTEIARVDKVIRATPLSVAWNRGEVHVPKGARWADAFVRELAAFGPGSRRDDQVDAAASAFIALRGMGSSLAYRPATYRDAGHERPYGGGGDSAFGRAPTQLPTLGPQGLVGNVSGLGGRARRPRHM